jgi:putative ABC transport system permease protein
MTATNSTKRSFTGLCLRMIALIGVIVPRRLRADWRQEWEAELRYREELLTEWDKLNWRAKLALLWHSAGAFADALWLQPRRMEDEMFQDLRFGLRMLWKNPGFTTAAVLSLAIGIGANSAIFSVVNGVALRPLPFDEPERLARIWHQKPRAGMDQMPINAGSVVEWRDHAQSFAGVAAYSTTTSVFTGEAEPEQIPGARINADLFPLLGLQPALGRGFAQAENKPGGARVILLSHSLWRRRFGGDPAIVGRELTLDHTNTYTVVGVMPPDVSFPGHSEFWTPETSTAGGRHDLRSLSVIARLKPGVTLAQATTELELINQRLQQKIPDDYDGWGVRLVTLHDSVVGSARQALLVLFGAVGFVLLIACVNVTSLLLARASARQKEIAVRAALGAGRLRLMRQMLTESLLLAVLGGGLGLLLAQWGVRGLVALKPPDLPRLDQVSVDGPVFVFTLGAALLVGLIFGLVPALQFSRPNVHLALKEGAAQASASGHPLRRYGLRGFMVALQTALAVVLLVGAGLMIKSFVKLRQVELGFEPSNAIALTIAPPFNRFPKEQRMVDYYQRMLDALKAVPGVSAAAAMTGMPIGGAFMNVSVLVDGRPAPSNVDEQRAFLNIASPDYFRAIGAPLKQGRLFTESDNEAAPRVALINETMARSLFAGANPTGQRISLHGEQDKHYEIVGVVADVKQFNVDMENKPGFYLPFRQYDAARLNLVVRTTVAPDSLLPALRSRILEVDRFTPITRVRALEQMVADSVGERRFYMLLLALFAAIAVTLAAIGIYGVLAYSVTQRTREIGIRMALGAETSRIMRMIVGHGLRLILTGGALGLLAAFYLTRMMESLLFGVSATDPLIFTAILPGLTAVGLAACYPPARKATKIDPLVALRHD